MRGSAAVDFLARDAAQSGHHWFGVVARLLRGDGKGGAEVAVGGRNVERREGGIDVGGPARAIGGVGRQQPRDLRAHLIRAPLRRFHARASAAGHQGQQRKQGDRARGRSDTHPVHGAVASANGD